MEEILASIRRIISEDDQPPAAEAVAAAPPPAPQLVAAPPPAPEPAPAYHEPEPEEDILELSQPAPPIAPRETHGDLDVFENAREAPPPARRPEPVHVAQTDDDALDDELLSDHAASAVASHFGALGRNIGMPRAGRTLEDVARELLRPLLKSWLDEHLPGMVQEAVRDAVDRAQRRRVY